MGSDPTDTPALSPQQACEQIEAAFDTIDAAQAVLHATPTDSVGTAFRVQMAARLETAERRNRALMYQVFAEIGAPPDEETSAAARSDLWQQLCIPPREIVRRMRIGARLHPRRTLLGPALAPELPAVSTAGTGQRIWANPTTRVPESGSGGATISMTCRACCSTGVCGSSTSR